MTGDIVVCQRRSGPTCLTVSMSCAYPRLELTKTITVKLRVLRARPCCIFFFSVILEVCVMDLLFNQNILGMLGMYGL